VRVSILIVTLLLGSLTISAPVTAQEGHPLKGSWIGEWGPSKIHSNDLLVVMNWDGKAVTGTINPGSDDIALKNTSLNPDGWAVHLEGDRKAAAGSPAVTYVLDGKIDGLAFRNRTITGTWKAGSESGKFKLTRQ